MCNTAVQWFLVVSDNYLFKGIAMNTQANHGGANFAKKTGENRKAAARHNVRSVDYQKMIEQKSIGDGHREADGYIRPGSRKKIGG